MTLAVVTPGRSDPRDADKGEAEPDQIVRGIADHGLIEVSDLY
jgi:hypothetical protein